MGSKKTPSAPSSVAMSKAEENSPELALPPRLQAKIRKRIRGAAILALMAYAVSLTFAVIGVFGGDPLPFALLRIVGLLIPMSLAVVTIRIVGRLRLQTAILLALGLECLVCFLISVTNPAYELPAGKILPGLTWVVPIIVMVPLLIPTPPNWILVASILCVMTVPLGTIVAYATNGRPEVDLARSLPFALISPTIAVCIAYFGATLVYETGVYEERIRRAGKYKIMKQLGEGGMGVVYEAMHERLLRPAAIKYINPDQLQGRFGSPQIAMDRFEREAEVLAQLRSPHTVELYDYDLDDQGRLYYVMELLEGWDLGTLVLQFGAVPAARAAHFLAQLCRSLGEAHDFGMVHRDVKPANVMACRYGRDLDFVKVLDFGLMTLRNEEVEPGPGNPWWDAYGPDFKSQLTQGHLVMGTPDFMSPEQVERRPLDGRSDLYAVGCVGYWLLTGKMLFEGGTPREKMRRHVEEAPPRPSANTEQAVPSAFEALLLQCLAKRPEDRPGNADRLALDLLASVTEVWDPERTRTWWKEHTPTGVTT
jgi:eukaryotic-like serine/threonine-protein kinase